MAEVSGRELLDEWRHVVESLLGSAASAAGRTELPRDLLGAMRRQVELVQEILESEQTLQHELASRAAAPLDAAFDLLEQTGASLRSQAAALSTAGEALRDTARLIETQADVFERTVGLLREPAEMAKAAAGLKRHGAERDDEKRA